MDRNSLRQPSDVVNLPTSASSGSTPPFQEVAEAIGLKLISDMEDKFFIDLIVDVFEKHVDWDETAEYCRPDEGIHYHTSTAYLEVAKASYEAGEQAGEQAGRQEGQYEGKQDGIKTVVEAITPQLELRNNAYPNDKTWWYYILDYEYWHTFLKEHGMEG